MDSFNNELYRIAGYSTGWTEEPSLIQDEFISENQAISTGYSCIFNWAQMRYIFVSKSIKNILGYTAEHFLAEGFSFSLSLIHPADKQKLRQMHLAIFNYYYKTATEERKQLRFSYNLRVKTAGNGYVQILRQSNFRGFTADGKPVLEYIYSTDITTFRYHSSMVLVVHKLSETGTYIMCHEQEFSDAQSRLSERENEVLALAKLGLTSKEIAIKLYLSIETVKSHRKNIIAKTGAGNLTAAINMIAQI